MEEILEIFAASQEGIEAGLRDLDAAAANAEAPFSPGGRDDETVGSLLAGLSFHESYHCGQLGVLRRSAGRDSVIK